MIFNSNINQEGSSTDFSGVTATNKDVINGKSFHDSSGQLVQGTLPQLVNHDNYISVYFSQNDTKGNINIVFRRNSFVKPAQTINKTVNVSPFDRYIVFKYQANIKYEFLGGTVEVYITNTTTNETKHVSTSNQPQIIVMSGYFDVNIPIKAYIEGTGNIKLIHQRKTLERTEEIYQDKRVYVITDYYIVS